MPHLERLEYQDADRESLEIITDLIDELLVSQEQPSAEQAASSVSTTDYFSIKRTFNYMESGMSSGWMWPLTETTAVLTYHRYKNPTRESYAVVIGSEIHQQCMEPGTPPPLQTSYYIEYHGKNREGKPQTRMSALNMDILGESLQTWDTRDLTNYDTDQLFDELGKVYDLQQRQANEQERLDSLFPDIA